MSQYRNKANKVEINVRTGSKADREFASNGQYEPLDAAAKEARKAADDAKKAAAPAKKPAAKKPAASKSDSDKTGDKSDAAGASGS